MPRADRGHETLEHTADVGLRVWAPSLDELFSEAALGLIDVMGTTSGKLDRQEYVALDAPDLGGLFVDWLSEVLFLFEAREFVPRDVRVQAQTDPWRLKATLEGSDAVNFRQHGPAVKAVTYHGLEIRPTAAGYEARVYLDV